MTDVTTVLSDWGRTLLHSLIEVPVELLLRAEVGS